MDNFAEQLVKKKATGSEKTKNTVILIAGIAVTFITGAYSLFSIGRGIVTFIMIMVAAAVGFATFFFHRSTKVEYEYTFTNGELDIDKIINQTKRKEMLTVQVSKFTSFGRYDDNSPEETSDMTVIMATDNIAEHEYYADFPHEDYGSTRLVFAPNEKVISNIVNFLHPSIKNKVRTELQNNYISEVSENI